MFIFFICIKFTHTSSNITIDNHRTPDLAPLLSATECVAKYLKKGDYVVYESTVFPGCTQERCVPVLEELSGLKLNTDFYVGYSPERINPGDAQHSLQNTTKIVSATTPEALENVALVYGRVVKAGVHKAPNLMVAEAAKIMENTQRDVNIALMNEFSIIFGKMGINTYDVLEAAGTKWNFLKFFPGLVGGHCIGVDPYYMVYKANELNYHPHVIQSGRFVNDSMGGYIGKQTVKKMIAAGISPIGARVLVLGITFKENVADIRNSKVADIIKELKSFSVSVDVIDPQADPQRVLQEYNIETTAKPSGKYQAVIAAVSHKEYVNLTQEDFDNLLVPNGVLIDIKGNYKGKISKYSYWSL
ncbi:MAG: nucleotide sugar dehydrogenase [Bacteroidales bacterium]|nr:nucleotide sugar dehydrogenase [Bacteroidales bacterium]